MARQPSPSDDGGRRAVHPVMTDDQRRFAAGNHNLVYSFLRRERLDPDEYYDIAAWGYLRAVLRYFREADTLKKIPFSSVAWKAMRSSISTFLRAEERRRETEQRYIEAQPAPADPFEVMEADLLLHDLVSDFGNRQYELASMRLQGYTIAEIARAQGMSPQRVSALLNALYRIYLKLYIH